MPVSLVPAFGNQMWHFNIPHFVYIYISGERVWSPQCNWTRTLLGGLWNVHSICEKCRTSVKRAQLLWNVHKCRETCTTSLKRAQHLWNVHNISETCTYRILKNTGWGRWNTLFPYIYIHKLAWGLPIFQISNPPKLFPYIYIYIIIIYITFPFKPPFIGDFRCHGWPVANLPSLHAASARPRTAARCKWSSVARCPPSHQQKYAIFMRVNTYYSTRIYIYIYTCLRLCM